jgi:hypothetical protein
MLASIFRVIIERHSAERHYWNQSEVSSPLGRIFAAEEQVGRHVGQDRAATPLNQCGRDCWGEKSPVLDEAQLHELALEILRVDINDLLSGEDFFELVLEGSPAHPLGFYHVIADAALRAELAPEFESTAQSPLTGRFTLAGVCESVSPA